MSAFQVCTCILNNGHVSQVLSIKPIAHSLFHHSRALTSLVNPYTHSRTVMGFLLNQRFRSLVLVLNLLMSWVFCFLKKTNVSTQLLHTSVCIQLLSFIDHIQPSSIYTVCFVVPDLKLSGSKAAGPGLSWATKMTFFSVFGDDSLHPRCCGSG